MAFADQYIASINSANLQDDEFHHATTALAAAALGDLVGGGFGALLLRVKYADGSIRKAFEAGSQNLAQLVRIWEAAVRKKGEERKWVTIRTERDVFAAHWLYKRVAQASLAHWLDGHCKGCNGTGTSTRTLRGCTACGGSGEAQIECSGAYERERILDMISELRCLEVSHAGRANRLLRGV